MKDYLQPFATLVLASAVVFLGYQQGKPRIVDVGVNYMPKVIVDNPDIGLGRRSALNVSGCGGY